MRQAGKAVLQYPTVMCSCRSGTHAASLVGGAPKSTCRDGTCSYVLQMQPQFTAAFYRSPLRCGMLSLTSDCLQLPMEFRAEPYAMLNGLKR